MQWYSPWRVNIGGVPLYWCIIISKKDSNTCNTFTTIQCIWNRSIDLIANWWTSMISKCLVIVETILHFLYLLVQIQSQQWSSVGSSTVGTGADTWQRRTHSEHQPLADDDCTPWRERRQSIGEVLVPLHTQVDAVKQILRTSDSLGQGFLSEYLQSDAGHVDWHHTEWKVLNQRKYTRKCKSTRSTYKGYKRPQTSLTCSRLYWSQRVNFLFALVPSAGRTKVRVMPGKGGVSVSLTD